ncbi:MAG: divalent metal cation transporter [Selenomonadales bacterium]|nr:divalent metal cation transporter [Selenomonadales bacterium]
MRGGRRRWNVRERLYLHCRLMLAVMGPGLLAAMADNDAGGIAMYMQAGSEYGYAMILVVCLSIVCLAVCQEMSARTGIACGQGLAALIRQRYGVGWSLFIVAILLTANLGTTAAEFAGIAAAGRLAGIPVWVSILAAGALLACMAVCCCYRRAERILLLLCLSFAGYLAGGYSAIPSTEEIWLSCLQTDITQVPFWLTAIGVIGTTVTPWGQFYLQSSVVDKGLGKTESAYVKVDVLSGCVLTGIVALAIVCIASDTLWEGGEGYTSLGQSAAALRPIFGDWANALFGIGLFGASLLAAFILPLCTAYAVCEALGTECGLDRTVREAPCFFGVYFFVLVGGMVGAFLAAESLLWVMIVPQIANGILLLPILFFMVLLAQDDHIMGTYRNTAWQDRCALLVLIILAAAEISLLLTL